MLLLEEQRYRKEAIDGIQQAVGQHTEINVLLPAYGVDHGDHGDNATGVPRGREEMIEREQYGIDQRSRTFHIFDPRQQVTPEI